jgi:hypothetical protein
VARDRHRNTLSHAGTNHITNARTAKVMEEFRGNHDRARLSVSCLVLSRRPSPFDDIGEIAFDNEPLVLDDRSSYETGQDHTSKTIVHVLVLVSCTLRDGQQKVV